MQEYTTPTTFDLFAMLNHDECAYQYICFINIKILFLQKIQFNCNNNNNNGAYGKCQAFDVSLE